MHDSITTAQGRVVSAHIGPVHIDRTETGVEVALCGTLTPTSRLTREQARNLGAALTAAGSD